MYEIYLNNIKVATDLSKLQMNILSRKLKDKGLLHINKVPTVKK
jgi:hypothetical protein